MTPVITVNLLRVLFVTFCGAIGASISDSVAGSAWPGLVLGLVLGLAIVLIDRLLKGIFRCAPSPPPPSASSWAFFSPTFCSPRTYCITSRRRSNGWRG